ncbi:circadian locomoter output cycles protein kaput-like isoform X1 [Odontomachus brunneus]|uniref:circadian locomoter output cycles protein kaput-like isoform X1 n=1 Tax=Odontomachus brunneus TaxID=486640 RepID=UPI0013F18A1F|nr:circadian locomoter output cycles protein kaput-like isoform X1 [Odontomachus brunneus]
MPVPSNPRASRNMAEKQRRDNLNRNISEMAALLPIVAGSSRRMDKISILRLAAVFLRTQYTLGRGSTNFLPRQFNEFDLERYFVDQLIGNGGFFLVVTATGKIVYVSRQVEQHLGHAQNELLGQSLYNFVHPEDHEELTRNIRPDDMQVTTAPSPTGVIQMSDSASENSSSSSEDSTSQRSEKVKLFREQRRNFKIRMSQRTVSRRENTQYECLDISGILRLAEACRNAESNGNKGRHREMTSTSNDIVFASIASLPKKRSITELSIIDANKDEYVTRHLIDGRIIYCDHRVSVVAGYLSEEVSGLSAFAFMHKDDYKWTMIGLQQMYVQAVTCGTSCYRLLAKTGEFIYLRTHGYLEYDKDTQTFESFVCINTLISEEEGIELIKEMKQRFSAVVEAGTSKFMIQDSDNSPLELDTISCKPAKCLEEPSRLEDAITRLVSDLPSPAVSEERFSPAPMQNTQFVKAAIISSRLPPAATQANKIGINKIEHYVALQGKGKQSPSIKEESNDDPHSCSGKYINSSDGEQMSDSESAKPSSGKSMAMYERINSISSSHTNVQSDDMLVQSNILPTREAGTNSSCNVTPRNHLPRLPVPQSASVLSSQKRIEHQQQPPVCDIKVERGAEVYDYLETREMQYYDDAANDTSVVSPTNDSHNRCTLKRICSEEDLVTMRNKKRSNDAYASTNGNDVQQSTPYVNCRTTYVADNGYPALTVEFNRYNEVNSQQLMTTESPNSSLHDVGVEYQQMVDNHPVAPLIITNPEEEQFNDLQDLNDDTLLNPELDANPEIMMKIFDNLRPVADFEKGFNKRKERQTVNDKIRRTYRQLANSMMVRESELNVLARDLENPALCAQRENLSQLQIEHNRQKQMLRNLQQEHHNMQMNHNTGM